MRKRPPLRWPGGLAADSVEFGVRIEVGEPVNTAVRVLGGQPNVLCLMIWSIWKLGLLVSLTDALVLLKRVRVLTYR